MQELPQHMARARGGAQTCKHPEAVMHCVLRVHECLVACLCVSVFVRAPLCLCLYVCVRLCSCDCVCLHAYMCKRARLPHLSHAAQLTREQQP